MRRNANKKQNCCFSARAFFISRRLRAQWQKILLAAIAAALSLASSVSNADSDAQAADAQAAAA